jgi:hypothetical protein
MNNKTNNNNASAAADETAQTGEGNAPRNDPNAPRIRELRRKAGVAQHFGQIAEWAALRFEADRLGSHPLRDGSESRPKTTE